MSIDLSLRFYFCVYEAMQTRLAWLRTEYNRSPSLSILTSSLVFFAYYIILIRRDVSESHDIITPNPCYLRKALRVESGPSSNRQHYQRSFNSHVPFHSHNHTSYLLLNLSSLRFIPINSFGYKLQIRLSHYLHLLKQLDTWNSLSQLSTSRYLDSKNRVS